MEASKSSFVYQPQYKVQLEDEIKQHPNEIRQELTFKLEISNVTMRFNVHRDGVKT